MTKHRHSWRLNSWRGMRYVEFRCACGETRERLMQTDELAYFKERHDSPLITHDTWRGLVNLLPKGWEDERDQTKKGEMMDEIEAFAAKHPDEVVITGCDDSYFASSDIVLATHETERSFMGITVLMFPQCDGRPPAEFFLYPGHLDGLLDALHEMKRRQRAKARLESRDRREEMRWWNSRKP